MQKFKVLRQHIGDKFYDPAGVDGPAVRDADPVTVAHLVQSGVLEAFENKAMAAAPEKKLTPAKKKTASVADAGRAQLDAEAKAKSEAADGDAAAKAQAEGK